MTDIAVSLARFGQVCGFAPDPSRVAAVEEFARRVQSLPEFERKLLAHVAELAYSEHQDGRKPGVAYFPELHETSGVGVDEMYGLLQKIEGAGFIRLEGEYPFQDVVPVDTQLTKQEGWPLLRDLVRFSTAEKISLRELLADLRFDELA
jgi:hypothetical protein